MSSKSTCWRHEISLVLLTGSSPVNLRRFQAREQYTTAAFVFVSACLYVRMHECVCVWIRILVGQSIRQINPLSLPALDTAQINQIDFERRTTKGATMFNATRENSNCESMHLQRIVATALSKLGRIPVFLPLLSLLGLIRCNFACASRSRIPTTHEGGSPAEMPAVAAATRWIITRPPVQ